MWNLQHVIFVWRQRYWLILQKNFSVCPSNESYICHMLSWKLTIKRWLKSFCQSVQKKWREGKKSRWRLKCLRLHNHVIMTSYLLTITLWTPLKKVCLLNKSDVWNPGITGDIFFQSYTITFAKPRPYSRSRSLVRSNMVLFVAVVYDFLDSCQGGVTAVQVWCYINPFATNVSLT